MMFKQVRVFYSTDNQLSKLQSSGIDIDHSFHKKNNFIEFVANDEEISLIQDLGFELKIIHNDLVSFYQTRLTNDISDRDFEYGSMGGYYTFSELEEQLNNLHNDYPSIVSEIQSIGITLDGNNIWAVKISDNPNINENEPEVLYTGLHHSREPMSYMNLFYFMYWLVENYEDDLEATTLINEREMWFVPAVNPDGLIYNQQIEPNGGGLQRKNGRETCINNDDYSNWDGIDLNRNYSYNWGFDNQGSSPNACEQTYRGTNAFSEPETNAIKNFVEQHDFSIAFNYHSYSNLLIHPFGHLPGYYPDEPDLTTFREFSQDMTQFNGYAIGTGIETVGYTVNGEACDWMYGTKGIFAMTPEIGSYEDGFWPPTSRIIPLAEENLFPNKYLAWVSGAFYDVELLDINQSFIQGQEVELTMNIFNKGLSASNGDVQIELYSELDSFDSQYINIGSLESRKSKAIPISFLVPQNLENGEEILVNAQISDDTGFYFNDEIQIIVGQVTNIFVDDAEQGFGAWTSNSWGITQFDSFDGNYSFTDSQFGDYSNNSSSSIQLDNPISLNDVVSPYMQFNARWDIEQSWDWVQILVSTNQSDWFPLIGDYMSSGSGQGVQNENQFGYDGSSGWITDKINLSQFEGVDNIWIKFELNSDGYVTSDGFYFDNFSIKGFTPTNNIEGDVNGDSEINVLDVVSAINIILGNNINPSNAELESADLNGDLSIDVLDIVLLVNLIIQVNS